MFPSFIIQRPAAIPTKKSGRAVVYCSSSCWENRCSCWEWCLYYWDFMDFVIYVKVRSWINNASRINLVERMKLASLRWASLLIYLLDSMATWWFICVAVRQVSDSLLIIVLLFSRAYWRTGKSFPLQAHLLA